MSACERPVELPPPPTVDAEGLEPLVAEAIAAARESLIVTPRDPEAGGAYGMTLDVHTFESEAGAA
jgi:hypothetical protein